MIFKKTNKLKSWALASCALSAIALAAPAMADGGETYEFDIAQKELGAALTDYGIATGNQVLFNDADVRGKTANAVDGVFTSSQAIELLLADAGVAYRVDANGTLLVGASQVRKVAPEAKEEARPFRVDRVADEVGAGREVNRIDETPDEQGTESDIRTMDKVTVTGSNIRGVTSSTSPTITLTREYIDSQGIASTQQLLRTLTQTLDAGENSVVTAGASNNNAEAGTVGINVRGLGAGATLALVNGRRLASGGGAKQVFDVSLIPFAAIERVEVLTDGASAVYGADAIAGVVNFVLRDDFDGAETRARFGQLTEGTAHEYQISQTFGRSWGDGSVLANYEYYERQSLGVQEKSFSQSAPQPSDLLPETSRHSIFISANKDVATNAQLFWDGMYSRRSTDFELTVSGFAGPSTTRRSVVVEQIGGAAGAFVDFSEGWDLEITGGYNINRTDNLLNGVDTATEFSLASAGVLLNGVLFSVPAGEIKLAIGGQYREEEFEEEFESGILGEFDASRNVRAAFGELFIPLIGAKNSLPGIEDLSVSLAARYEEYSDFGASTNPKIGVSYVPIDGLKLRGTFGTSFRAPDFFELYGEGVSFAFPGAFLVPPAGQAAAPNVLFLNGPNPGLAPEEARTWTAGFDQEDFLVRDLKLSATYFDVAYDDRIADPLTSGISSLFAAQDLLGPLLVFPGSPEFPSLVSTNFPVDPSFNPFGLAQGDIGAFFDGRVQNVAATDVSGVDVSLSYSRSLEVGTLNLGANASYLFEFEQQNLPLAAARDTLNRQGNPIDFRMRGNVGLDAGATKASLFLNYVDSYKSDFIAGPLQPVSSWTTVDANLSHEFSDLSRRSMLNGTTLSLSVVNLFDKAPPFVDRTRAFSNAGQNFDGANANALGRVVSVQLSKTF